MRRLARLNAKLEGYGVPGDYEAVDAFLVWQRSNYVVHPFPGSWNDQPLWVQRAFRRLLEVETWWELQSRYTVDVDKDNLPRIEDM